MNKELDNLSERALILAPQGRDAFVAASIMREAGLVAEISDDLPGLLRELPLGAGLAVLTEESIRSADIKGLVHWIGSQPPWSDFPFVRSYGARRPALNEILQPKDKWKHWETSASWSDRFTRPR